MFLDSLISARWWSWVPAADCKWPQLAEVKGFVADVTRYLAFSKPDDTVH